MENSNNSQQFFNKKRILIVSLFFLLVIALLTLTIYFVIAPNLKIGELGTSISNAFNYDIEFAIFLIVLLLAYTLVKTFVNIYPFFLRLKQWKIKVTTKDYLLFGFFYSFICMISPSSILSDPYAVYWLKTKKVSLYKASAITINTDFLSTAAGLVLSWPCIVYMGVTGTLDSLIKSPGWRRTIFIFIFIGMGIDVIVLGFIFMFGLSKRIHIFISIIFNKLRKFLKMNYLTKSQITKKYMEEAVMRREFVRMLKDFKGSLLIFLVIACGFVYMYTCIYLNMKLINDDITCRISFIHVFSAVNVANSANKFIPLPSGQGSMDLCLVNMLEKSNAFTKLMIDPNTGEITDYIPWSEWANSHGNAKVYVDNLINGSTLFWRIFTTYVPGLVGVVFGVYEIMNIIKRRRLSN